MTDPIADLLTRVRNANLAHKDEVVLPASNVKARVAEILAREGYVDSVSVSGEGKDRAELFLWNGRLSHVYLQGATARGP